MHEIGLIDNPTPKEDQRWIGISEMVDELSIDDLAYEINSYGLRSKVEDIIFEAEVPEPRAYIVEEMVCGIELNKLINFCMGSTVEKIREMLIDYLYHRQEDEDY